MTTTNAKEQSSPPKGLMDVKEDVGPQTVLADEEGASRVRLATLGKIGPAMLTLVVCVALTYLVPALEIARPWRPGDALPFWNLLERYREDIHELDEHREKIEEIAREALAEEPRPTAEPVREIRRAKPGDALPPYRPHPDDDKVVEQPLELFEGHELDTFFAALARTEAAFDGAITRVVHWGDSAIGVDGITSAIRRRMQSRFGDAGHGFHLMAPPNASYRHRGVRFRHNDGWSRCFIIRKCRRDGHYGLGGTTFWSNGGAESRFAPGAKEASGRVSRFEIWYAAQPGGGRIRARVDKQAPVVIKTRSDRLEDRWHIIEVPDGPHRLTVRATGWGRVRLYGVTMERDVPGVVWDGLSLIGAFTNRMLELDEDHLRGQLEHRAPDLAVLMFGGNDMIRRISMEDYAEEYRKVLRLIRRARPEMPCVVMAPLDHAVRKGRRPVSLPIVAPMVEAQRAAARSEGCAFFDTYAAMGGKGSAGRWFRQRPRLISGDLSHATFKGQIVIGEMFYRALMHAYVAYRRRTD